MDYSFFSSFESVFINSSNTIININDYIKNFLNVETDFFTKTMNKNFISYTISLYDEYEKVYWIYDQNDFNTHSSFSIKKCVEDYINENYNYFRKSFICMRLHLLNKLNHYDVFLFKMHLNEYYHIDKNNASCQKLYLNEFNNILNDAINQQLGTYITLFHKDFFDEMLYIFCKTKKDEQYIDDASIIIKYIIILTCGSL
jgi:hypothetical protein